MPPWLTDDEIADLCAGLTQGAAQARFLRQLGLTVRAKHNGRPLVMRAHLEQVMMPAETAKPSGKREPNRAALAARWSLA